MRSGGNANGNASSVARSLTAENPRVGLGKRFAATLRGGHAVGIPTLQYFETAQVAGIPGKSMTVRLADGRVLGRFRGVVIDSFNSHLRYFVVRAWGWFGKTTLVPAYSPKIDLARRAIEIDANDNDLSTVHHFTLEKALTFRVCVRAASFATVLGLD